jgi:hypothetical protein
MMLNTPLLLVARLRISGVIPPSTPMPSCYTRGQPYLYLARQQKTISNYSQQDATFLDLLIFTDAFRRFLRPSSGAHNCTYSFRYCQTIQLLAATVEEMELFYFFQGSS